MKKTMTILFLLSLILGSLAAQMRGQGNPPPTAEEEVARLDEKLDLDKGQEKEILKILTVFSEEMKGIMESGKRPEREEMDSLMENRNNSLKECLTDRQIEIYDEMMREMRPPMPE